MSRFKNYIIAESGKLVKVAKPGSPNMKKTLDRFLQLRCKPYLQLLKGKDPLYRASGNFYIPQDQILGKSVRQDRKPQGTDLEAFKLFNAWLAKNGHIRRDKSVSAKSTMHGIERFGVAHYFFL